MLKGIPIGISPQLMFNLMKMGHGDEIVIADGNFPAESTNSNVVRADGQGCVQVLSNIMQLLPLDTYENCFFTMEPMAQDKERYPNGIPPIWHQYSEVVSKTEPECPPNPTPIERFAFYERAKKAFVVVATSESAQYANVILKKGCIKEQLSK